MKKLLFFLFLIPLFVNAQWTYQKDDCRLKWIRGGDVRIQFNIADLTYTEKWNQYIEMKDGVSVLTLKYDMIDDYVSDQIDSLELQLDAWIAECGNITVSGDTLFINGDTLIVGGVGSVGPTGATGPTGPQGATGPTGAGSTYSLSVSSDTLFLNADGSPQDTVVFVTTTEILVAASDLVTDITTGTSKAYFRMPYAATLTDVSASVLTAPTGTDLTVDINEGGTTVLSTKLSIDAGETTSVTAATPPVISDSSLAYDSIITIDVDGVGTGCTGLIVTLYLQK